MKPLPPERTPDKVRISTFEKTGKVGQGITVTARLSRPPIPAVPGGYDPARRAYFQKIGGYGYAVSYSEPLVLPAAKGIEGMASRVAKWRYSLADRIRNSAPAKTAGLQVALLTGIRTYISDYQTDNLRKAGLAHILAISGLHMGLVAGTIYALATYCLASVFVLARRMDVRKPAAIIGAIAATVYLVMSGASVATQRAYIMALIVFLAILMDRRAFSLRSVALAALITLFIHPEAVLSAGFQMSFSAVTGLVVVYQYWDRRRAISDRRTNIVRKLWGNLSTLSVTSFVAGGSTSAYAAMHFNRVAVFGLLGNLLAMPVFTFWVMPLGLLVFACLPFGLEKWPLFFMGQGIGLILSVAAYVADLPGAVKHIQSASAYVLALYSIGFVGLCLGPKLVRIFAIGCITLSLLAWWMTPVPHGRLSEKGDIAFWNAEGDRLYVSKKRRDRFGRNQFVRQAGFEDVVFDEITDHFPCDSRGCSLEIENKTIAVIQYPDDFLETCSKYDLVILATRPAGPRNKRLCKSLFIDKATLYHTGAIDIFIKEGKVKFSPTQKNNRERPWSR